MKKIIIIPSRHYLGSKIPWPIVVAVLLLWACSKPPVYKHPPVKDDYVVVDTAELKVNSPEFFSYRADKKYINFFVIKTEHTVEAYLDACMKCYPHRKGFRVEGFFLVCRYCGSRYPLDKLKAGLGTCYPIPLKAEKKGQFLYISIKTLKQAERYF
ncbi:MAG: DUF2318 domain-containing protein [Nitrospirae bacterium]|nr:MAG: DUF2318 domain-containing protein [Nitrospirota bacterium]